MSNSVPQLQVSVADGTRRYDFYSTSAFREYLSLLTPPPPTLRLTSYLDEFRAFPQVDQVLLTYYNEILKCTENGLRLAPSMLIGCLSELLVLRLLKAIGDYLEDLNAVDNFLSRHSNVQRQFDYTREMVRKGKEKLQRSITLQQTQLNAFRDFDAIVAHVFDSIRLRRNDYVHPKPEMCLDDLPPENVITANVQAFNPYAKVILTLIDIFKQSST